VYKFGATTDLAFPSEMSPANLHAECQSVPWTEELAEKLKSDRDCVAAGAAHKLRPMRSRLAGLW